MKKRGFSIVAGPMLYWILAIMALVFFFVLIMILQGKAEGAINLIKNALRFSQ